MTKRLASPPTYSHHQTGGFTLVELLVVLTIMSLLAALVAPQVMKYLGRAKSDTAALQIKDLESGLDLYLLDNGAYPSQAEGLNALFVKPASAPNWNGPYLKKKYGLNDSWGRPYLYLLPGQHGDYDLYSLGADNKAGGEGENKDVSNW